MMTPLQAAFDGLLQTIADFHIDFFRQLDNKHATVAGMNRIIRSARKEEQFKLAGVVPLAAALLKIGELKDKYNEDLPKFDALVEVETAVRALMPEAPEIPDAGAQPGDVPPIVPSALHPSDTVTPGK